VDAVLSDWLVEERVVVVVGAVRSVRTRRDAHIDGESEVATYPLTFASTESTSVGGRCAFSLKPIFSIGASEAMAAMRKYMLPAA
jgi:hypothetical protein